MDNAINTIEQIIATTGVPGVSIGIIERGDISSTHHLGYRDVNSRRRANDDTRYSIGSVTKAMVSALVGIEVFKGRVGLDWEKPICAELPEFNASTPEIQANSTIIDMLAHRTGATSLDDLCIGADNVLLLPKSEVLRTFATFKPAVPFRTIVAYNNWGYEVVAQLLEKLSGLSLSHLLTDRLFAPLGMTRTSTSWNTADDNEAFPYAVLEDLSPVRIPTTSIGNDTIMEAAGGVKASLHDLLVYYLAFMKEMDAQYKQGTDSTNNTPFKNCRILTTNHNRFEGSSFREQGYSLGWGRAQVPGQVGRFSPNAALGDQPILGKGSPSRTILYHHGILPGFSSAVYLVPELQHGVIILQNSLTVLDTADFIGQSLLEALLEVPEPNDYLKLSLEFHRKAMDIFSGIRATLDKEKIPNTKPRPLSAYVGRYFNDLGNFFIDVEADEDGKLVMKHQGLESQSYLLRHYHHDSFEWLPSFDEIVKRGRVAPDYEARYYILDFVADRRNQELNQLHWAVDPNFPEKAIFRKDSKASQSQASSFFQHLKTRIFPQIVL